MSMTMTSSVQNMEMVPMLCNNILPTAFLEAFFPRLGLMNSFHRAANYRFIYAHAPVGSGKTVSSLLWLAECERRAIRICLDRNDDIPSAFYYQLASGIVEAQPDNIEIKKMAASSSFSSSPVEHTIRIINDFHPDQGLYALALDDIQCINNPELTKSIPYILKLLPSSFVVLFLSSNDLPEYLKKLVKPSAIIKPEQFLFTEAEIQQYFESLGRNISPAEIKVIRDSTDGLPIGVSVVAKTGEIPLGRGGFYADSFLNDSLLSNWSREMQSFMLKTCITEEITPELANKLTGRKDSKNILDTLCATNTYITKISNDTYRYHRLLLNFLRSKMNNVKPSVYKTIGDYYLEKCKLCDAFQYYAQSGDFDTTKLVGERMIQQDQHFFSLALRLNNALKIDWVRLTEHDKVGKPHAYMWCLWIHYLLGEAKDLCAYFDKLYALGDEIYTEDPSLKQIAAAISYLEPRKSLMELNKEIEQTSEVEYVGGMLNILYFSMNMPFLSRSYRDASEYAANIESIENFLCGSLCRLLGGLYTLCVPQIKAELYYEKNMLVEAERAAAASTVYPELWDRPDYAFCHHIILASIAFASGNKEETALAFANMETYIKDKDCEYLLPNFLSIKIKLALYDADKNEAQAWLNNYFVIEPKTERVELYKIYQHFTTVRAYIVLGRYREALELLAKLKRLGTDFNRPYNIAEAEVLLSIIEWAEGKKDRAVTTLEGAMAIMQPFGFIRVIANEARSIMPVLKRLASKVGRQTYTGILDRSYVNEVSIAANQFAKLYRGLLDDNELCVKVIKLSKRQKLALDLLSKGYKNERIAEEMGLEVITVRCHLSNAYRKLGVHSGIEALFKARELGIVE